MLALGFQFIQLLLIDGGALAGLAPFRLPPAASLPSARFGLLHVGVQRLGFSHQIECAVLGFADGRFAEADLVLERAVLLVGFGAQHLIPKLGDLLILHLHFVFQLLSFLLIGRQRGLIRLQPAKMRIQGLFDLGDMFG